MLPTGGPTAVPARAGKAMEATKAEGLLEMLQKCNANLEVVQKAADPWKNSTKKPWVFVGDMGYYPVFRGNIYLGVCLNILNIVGCLGLVGNHWEFEGSCFLF